MPMKSGSSNRTVSQNVSELLKAYHRTGTIGNTTPKSNEKARQIALAAAFTKAGRKK